MSNPLGPSRDEEEAWQRCLRWFQDECSLRRKLWEERITEVLATSSAITREDVEKVFADNSTIDLQGLKDELASMLVRTSILVAASTLMFAAFLLKGSGSGGGTKVVIGTALIVTALLMTAVAFIFSIKPMAPPFKRAFTRPYEKRRYWTLLVTDDFTRWVMNC